MGGEQQVTITERQVLVPGEDGFCFQRSASGKEGPGFMASSELLVTGGVRVEVGRALSQTSHSIVGSWVLEGLSSLRL